MSSNPARSEPHQHRELAERFNQRALRLRKRADIYLGIIIAVLVVGVTAFVLANDIASLSFRPQTAEAQLSAVTAAIQENKKNREVLANQIEAIQGTSTISAPFDSKIKRAKADYSTFEDSVLAQCANISNTSDGVRAGPRSVDAIVVTPSYQTIGEYEFSLPQGKTISFSNAQSAQQCAGQFVAHTNEINEHLREMSNLNVNKIRAVEENEEHTKSQTAPLLRKLADLSDENLKLENLQKQVEIRVVEEKLLGAPLQLERRTGSENLGERTDWARVIETNATRIGALVAMFFLVSILVPHYRYNIRMASFYEARSDAMELLSKSAGVDDFQKTFEMMTPNIDFGKAPPTPLEQMAEAIKAAKS
jgi:hypothetical protein